MAKRWRKDGMRIRNSEGKRTKTDGCCCTPPGDCHNCANGNSTGRVRITVAGIGAGAAACSDRNCARWHTPFTFPDDHLEDINYEAGCAHGGTNIAVCPDTGNELCTTPPRRIMRAVEWAVLIAPHRITVSLSECNCQNLGFGWQCEGGYSASYAITLDDYPNCLSGVYVLDYVGDVGPIQPVCDYTAATVTVEFIP